MQFWYGLEILILILHPVPNNLLTPFDINVWIISSFFELESWLDFELELNLDAPVDLAQGLTHSSSENEWWAKFYHAEGNFLW